MFGVRILLATLLIVFVTQVSCKHVHNRQAMSYVVERGCMYLAHYVRKNYYSYVPDHPPTPAPTTMTTLPTHTNWVTYMYDIMRADYVPMELFKGLMNCGKEYSMYAIDAPEWLRIKLGIDYHAVPGLG